MNKKLLKSIISLKGHNFCDLADIIGISRTRLSAKINEKNGAEFKKTEIEKIKETYSLSPEQVDAIFFSN